MSHELIAALSPLIARVNTRFCWSRKGGAPTRINEPLTTAKLQRHLDGAGVSFGVSAIAPGTSTTAVALFDLDSHKGKTPWVEMQRTAIRLAQAMRRAGLEPVAFRSSGGKGIHLYALWEQQQDAYSVRVLMCQLLTECGFANGTKGVAEGQIELFPKQDEVPVDGFGSMFILPLAGESVPLDPILLDVIAPDDLIGWLWPMSAPVTVVAKPEPVRAEAPVFDTKELQELASALEAIPNEGEYELDYDAWRNIIFGIHHATQGSAEGHALAHAFSSRSSKYDPDFLDSRVWPYIKDDHATDKGPITGRTVVATAREYGWQPNLDNDFQDYTNDPAAAADAPDAAPAAGTPEKPKKRERFASVSLHEYSTKQSPPWIIDGVMPKAQLIVVFGESGSGKSFLASDMGLAIAEGRAWRDRDVRQGRVTYIVAEGAGGFVARSKAMVQHFGLDGRELPFRVIAAAPNLMGEDDVALARAIKADGGADVIFVDTFAQATAGANENSGEDVGLALAHCARLGRVTGATIVLIHHAGKDLAKGARGWSGLRAAADAEIEVCRFTTGERVARVSKQKDGEDGQEFGFKLVPVSVGQDEKGRDITSCVVEHTNDTKTTARAPRQPQGANMQVVWHAAHDVADLCGEPLVAVESVLDEAARRMPFDSQGGKRDRRRDLAKRALADLAAGRWLQLADNNVVLEGGAE